MTRNIISAQGGAYRGAVKVGSMCMTVFYHVVDCTQCEEKSAKGGVTQRLVHRSCVAWHTKRYRLGRLHVFTTCDPSCLLQYLREHRSQLSRWPMKINEFGRFQCATFLRLIHVVHLHRLIPPCGPHDHCVVENTCKCIATFVAFGLAARSAWYHVRQ